MAYVNTTRVANFGLGERFAAVVKMVQLALKRRAIYTQTVRELNELSDRDLTDLGIHRSMIAMVATEAAYGK